MSKWYVRLKAFKQTTEIRVGECIGDLALYAENKDADEAHAQMQRLIVGRRVQPLL